MGMVIFRGPGYEASFRCFSLADGRAIGRAEKSRLGNWPHAGEKTRMPEESTVAHSASLRVGRHLAYDKCVGLSDESMAIEFVPAAPEVAAKKDLFGEEENLTSGPGRD